MAKGIALERNCHSARRREMTKTNLTNLGSKDNCLSNCTQQETSEAKLTFVPSKQFKAPDPKSNWYGGKGTGATIQPQTIKVSAIALPTETQLQITNSSEPDCNPPHIQPHHWQEWANDSAVDPGITKLNLISLDGTAALDRLFYSPRLPRLNNGRVSTGLLRTYAPLEDGGWWVDCLDPLNDWQPQEWSQFKPDNPRWSEKQGKPVKYDPPPKTQTRCYYLRVTLAVWHAIAQRYGVPMPDNIKLTQDGEALGFWEWLRAHPEIPLFVTEGSKKAGAILTAGFAAVALPGVWNGRRVDPDGSTLHPDLQPFATHQRPIYFAFDRDRKRKTVKHVGLALIKMGKCFEALDCPVRVMQFPALDDSGKTGADDLLKALGVEAFESACSEAIELGYFSWLHHHQQRLTLPPSVTRNVPDLSEVGLRLDDEGIIGIASAKGTGKTKLLKQATSSADKVVLLTHRKCLGRGLAKRLDLTWKEDADKVEGRWFSESGYTDRIALCVDSLLSLNPDSFAGCTLVIDEVCQVVAHLILSATCQKDGKRPALLARLNWLVRIAGRVIVADADLDDSTLNYLRTLRGGDKPPYLVRNDFQPTGYPVRFIVSKGDSAIFSELLEDASKGLNLFVATDCKLTANRLKTSLPNIQVNVISSDTSGTPDAIDYVENINERCRGSQVLAVTPSLATGTSIEVDHFDKVYGLFYGVVSDADIAQSLARVRAPIPRVVWSLPRGNNFSRLGHSTYPHQLKETLKTRFEREASLIRSSLNPDIAPTLEQFSWDDNPHLQLWAQINATTNRAMHELRDNVRYRLMTEGHPVEVVNLEPDEVTRDRQREIKQQLKQGEREAIASARELNPTEISELSGRDDLPLEDRQALERARIADFYCVEAVTPEIVEADKRGLARLQVLRLECLLFEQMAKAKDSKGIERQAYWKSGLWVPDIPMSLLERNTRSLMGLTDFLVPGQPYRKEDLEPLGEFARDNREAIKTLLGVSIPEDPELANDTWIFKRLFAQVGLKTQSKGTGDEKVSWIDAESWEAMRAILSRRLKRHLESGPLANSVSDVDTKQDTPPSYMTKYRGGIAPNGIDLIQDRLLPSFAYPPAPPAQQGSVVSWTGRIGAWMVEAVVDGYATVRRTATTFASNLLWTVPIRELRPLNPY